MSGSRIVPGRRVSAAWCTAICPPCRIRQPAAPGGSQQSGLQRPVDDVGHRECPDGATPGRAGVRGGRPCRSACSARVRRPHASAPAACPVSLASTCAAGKRSASCPARATALASSRSTMIRCAVAFLQQRVSHRCARSARPELDNRVLRGTGQSGRQRGGEATVVGVVAGGRPVGEDHRVHCADSGRSVVQPVQVLDDQLLAGMGDVEGVVTQGQRHSAPADRSRTAAGSAPSGRRRDRRSPGPAPGPRACGSPGSGTGPPPRRRARADTSGGSRLEPLHSRDKFALMQRMGIKTILVCSNVATATTDSD